MREIRRMVRALALVAGLPAVGSLALGACGDPSDSAGFLDPEIHPDAANAVPADAGVIGEDSLPVGLSADALDAWRSARDDLLAAQTVTRLGTEEEGPQLFGRIGDVAVDAEGNVFVFDPLAMELRVFDSEGGHVSSVGGMGDGPLELRYNLFGVFELLDEGRVLVANGASTKLFRETEGQWQLDKAVEAPGLVTDVCVIGDRAFFGGWSADDNTLVQTTSLATGVAETGLVQGYQHPDHLVRSKMAEGVRIGCLATDQQMVVAWAYLSMVASFRLGEQSPTWTSRVEGRLPSRIVYGLASDQTGAETPAVEDQTDPRDFLNTLLPISSGHLLIQYSRASRSPSATPSIRTYLVDAATGLGAFLGTELPVIAAAVSDGYVAVFDDPYPQLEIRRAGTGPASTSPSP